MLNGDQGSLLKDPIYLFEISAKVSLRMTEEGERDFRENTPLIGDGERRLDVRDATGRPPESRASCLGPDLI